MSRTVSIPALGRPAISFASADRPDTDPCSSDGVVAIDISTHYVVRVIACGVALHVLGPAWVVNGSRVTSDMWLIMR